jgi:serine O-acetyltransferase
MYARLHSCITATTINTTPNSGRIDLSTLTVHADIDITTGISIPAESTIPPGLRIHYFGGIIVHANAVLGEGCILIGDYCRIGANAVVLTSVPQRCVAVGVPAVIKASTTQSRDGGWEELG